jgi:gamma-glutamyltranspeptidase/glutathione hydrolase
MASLGRALFAALAMHAAGASLAQPQPEAATGYEAREAAYARRFMVAAANPLAADAGAEVLRTGGSALDAAVAVQMVLGLVEPQSSGIGGGAFLLHWSQAEKRVRSYDGRETAPAAARPDRFLDSSGRPLARMEVVVSGRSVGVPGVLRMLELAHRRHGRIAWAKLFEPAIRLAEQGFPMSPRLHRLLELETHLRNVPAARTLFYGSDGRPRPVGAPVVNTAYAATLRAIAQFGADAFYTGAIAEDIVRAVNTQPKPGDLALEDLTRYRALEREPVCAAYRGRRICSMGPPGGGVSVLQILGILERTDFDRAAPNSGHAVHLFAEAGRLAYADRARYLADPDFVLQPVAGLLAPAYLEARARLVGARAMGRAEPGLPRGARAHADAWEVALTGTSHVSIVDARGDALAMTTTIEHAFGSRILVRGFLLNNQLTDFAFVPASGGRPDVDGARAVANRVEPGKRPRSAMSPALVFDRDGSLRAALGSPGGSAIINYVAKTLVAMLDWGLDAQSAAALPNFGSRNGPTEIERDTVYETLVPALRERGHEVRLAELTSGVHVIERVRMGDRPGRFPSWGWRGGADPRREGAARGE